MTTQEARQVLGYSRQRVDQLYRDGTLTGPERIPRSPIKLWSHAVEAEAISRRTSRGRSLGDPGRTPTAHPESTAPDKDTPAPGLEEVRELRERLDDVISAARDLSTTIRGGLLVDQGRSEDLLDALQRFEGALDGRGRRDSPTRGR